MLKGKKLREAVASKLGLDLNDVRLSKGRAMVKAHYFYRNGTLEGWVEKLQDIQNTLGGEFKVVEYSDRWAPWPKDSFLVAWIVSNSDV